MGRINYASSWGPRSLFLQQSSPSFTPDIVLCIFLLRLDFKLDVLVNSTTHLCPKFKQSQTINWFGLSVCGCSWYRQTDCKQNLSIHFQTSAVTRPRASLLIAFQVARLLTAAWGAKSRGTDNSLDEKDKEHLLRDCLVLSTLGGRPFSSA